MFTCVLEKIYFTLLKGTLKILLATSKYLLMNPTNLLKTTACDHTDVLQDCAHSAAQRYDTTCHILCLLASLIFTSILHAKFGGIVLAGRWPRSRRVDGNTKHKIINWSQPWSPHGDSWTCRWMAPLVSTLRPIILFFIFRPSHVQSQVFSHRSTF